MLGTIFGRFDFSISYRPGSKEHQTHALSRIFDHSDRPVSPECIVPERLVVSAVTWEIESKVRTVLEGVNAPARMPNGPVVCAGEVTVQRHSMGSLFQRGLSSRNRSAPCFWLKQRFWWRAMARDIREFVLACSVCARGKTSNRAPEGLLQSAVSPFETLVPYRARFRYLLPSPG